MAAFSSPVLAHPEAKSWLAATPRDKAVDWVRALRETGAEAFAKTGLPTPAWEGWQYTSLRPLAADKFKYSTAPAMFDPGQLPAPLIEDSYRAVVVNGQYQPKLSRLPKGVEVVTLSAAIEQKQEGLELYLASIGDLEKTPFKALNTAYMHDGFVLKARGDVKGTVEVLFYNLSGAAVYPRMLYWLEKNSGLTVLEHHCGNGESLANGYTQIVQEQDSRLKFYRFQDEHKDAHHFSLTALTLHKNAQFEGFSLSTGARLARQEYQMQLLGDAVSCSIGGIYILAGQQNHDFTVLADHFEPGGKSVQKFKGVVDAEARAIYQGKIYVRRSAQKTDGCQSHHALLLSDQAQASAKPELEIYADDVKCSHGATAGHLSAEALFYLKSRGIPEAEAKTLLIEAFLDETVDIVTSIPVREFYLREITEHLEGIHVAG